MIITDYCTGCRLCEQLCSHNAISIILNAEGFLEPLVDVEKCVECNLCKKRCPQNTELEKSKKSLAYAVRLKDECSLSNSASGGAFIGIAKAFVLSGGYVVGVVYDDSWKAVFQITNDLSGLRKMQSSKYLQADTGRIFGDIKTKLQEGEKVLFAGTACQVAGLKRYLNKDYENLITFDIICHGVTSPLMFNKYIQWLENKVHEKILTYNFRSKKNGWGLFYTYTYSDKTITKPMYVDPYYKVFLQGDAYRECCYRCIYACPERISDITLGDYWGIEQEHPSFFSNKGVSSVLINTDKGSHLFEMVKEDFYILETETHRIARHNANLIRPTHRNDKRNNFYDGILTTDSWFDIVANKYKPTIIDLIKANIPIRLRALLNKYISK